MSNFLRRLIPRRNTAIPVPPPASPDQAGDAQAKQRGFARWIVAFLLGAVILGVRIYYPESLQQALRFADSILARDNTGILAPTAVPPPASEVPTGTPVPATGTPATATVTASPTPTPSRPLVGQSGEGSAEDIGEEVSTFAMGMNLTGRPGQDHITLWAYPGSPSGYLAVHRYGPGTRFTLMDPMRPGEANPVLINGLSWVRVEAEDGLVGWVQTIHMRKAAAASDE